MMGGGWQSFGVAGYVLIRKRTPIDLQSVRWPQTPLATSPILEFDASCWVTSAAARPGVGFFEKSA
jgi:hypothetical protein